jgi:hypothetical protein
MKRLLILLFLLSSFVAEAQFLRTEFGVDFLRAEELGVIYRDVYNHTPEFRSRDEIHEVYWHYGIRARLYWALNWGTYSFEKFNYGPEAGFTINKNSYEMTGGSAYDKNASYHPTYRFPLLFSFRQGSYSASYKKKCGYKISTGIELIKSNVRNEEGIFVLPIIELSVAVRNLGIGITYYPSAIKSSTLIDGVAYPRLATHLFSCHMTFSLDHYPKKYKSRPNKK